MLKFIHIMIKEHMPVQKYAFKIKNFIIFKYSIVIRKPFNLFKLIIILFVFGIN